jgi:hypothetical protein
MKGIAIELGEMNIPLRPEARPIRQRPYRLNPIYKKKFEDEIKKMLEAGIIEPVRPVSLLTFCSILCSLMFLRLTKCSKLAQRIL